MPSLLRGCRAQGAGADPSLKQIEGWYRRLLTVAPGCNVQLSGGEPTLRDDLPQIIRLGRALGFPFLQLNSNGLRIGREDGYARRLAEAGLRMVFLQFDGVDDVVHRALRGEALLSTKDQAIARCAEAGLGVVLVTTVVRDVNLQQLGDILSFALENPAVRGIHLQPLALLGRYPDAWLRAASRVTLPDAMRALAEQSAGRIRLEELAPGDCEHALCSFSCEYLRRDDGTLLALARGDSPVRVRGTAGAPAATHAAATHKAAHVARRWSGAASAGAGCCGSLPGRPLAGETPAGDQWDGILRQIHDDTFSVSGMAFQDAWTLDLQRLRRCYLHVMAADGRLVPFCAYNLTAADGHGLAGGRLGTTTSGSMAEP